VYRYEKQAAIGREHETASKKYQRSVEEILISKMKNLRGIILTLASAIFIVGCGTSSYRQSNIKWAYDKNIIPIIEIIPDNSWEERNNSGKPGAVCTFTPGPPPRILVKEGNVIECLEHEFGHLREHSESVPYHSKYAKYPLSRSMD